MIGEYSEEDNMATYICERKSLSVSNSSGSIAKS